MARIAAGLALIALAGCTSPQRPAKTTITPGTTTVSESTHRQGPTKRALRLRVILPNDTDRGGTLVILVSPEEATK
jgi:hypothetical protein